jgi:hypothetical protein
MLDDMGDLGVGRIRCDLTAIRPDQLGCLDQPVEQTNERGR